jgi:hypothetical protein
VRRLLGQYRKAQYIPIRSVRPKALQRRGSPEAAGICGALPEIKQLAALPRRIGDVVASPEDHDECIAGEKAGIRTEVRYCPRVLRLDPGQSARALEFLKPEIWIVVGQLDRRAGIDGGISQRALGINIRPTLLTRADDVIE